MFILKMNDSQLAKPNFGQKYRIKYMYYYLFFLRILS